MQLVKVEAFHPEKMPEEILTLFTSTLAELVPLPRSPIETLIIDRIERQLMHCLNLTPHVYRNAELMGLVITHNYFCLIDSATRNPAHQRLAGLITSVYEKLPNKASVDHFLANADYEYSQDPTLSSLLSIECRTLMSQLLESECRSKQSDLPLEQVINLMIQGKLPFLVTCFECSSLRLDPVRFDPIRTKVFDVIAAGIQAHSSVIKKVASLINPTQLNSDMTVAIAYISKINPHFYSKPSCERAFIALHLVLLKGLLESPLVTSNTMRTDSIVFLNLFKHFYQFFSDHHLTGILTQDHFGQVLYGRLLKFKFAALLEMQVLETRKEFCHYITDGNFLHAISHITSIDLFLNRILINNPEKNVLRDLLCNALIYKLFSLRIGEFRISCDHDVFGWLHSRGAATTVQLTEYIKILKNENGDHTKLITKLLTCYSPDDITLAQNKLPGALNHFVKIAGLINDIVGICNCDDSAQDRKLLALQKLTTILGEETVSNLNKIIAYWYGQWDNEQPLDFAQVKSITERLVFTVITGSVNDRDLNNEISRILSNTCTLTQKDKVTKERSGCLLM